MDQMEKIPVPLSRKWAEIRQRFLPVITFLVVGLIVWYLWHERVDRAMMTGQVQGERVEITAPEAGYLADISIEEFDQVQAGHKIGEVVTTNPKVLESRLAVINAEIDMIRHTMDPIAGLQRNQLDLYNLQMDLMERRVSLASSRIEKSQLLRDLERREELFEQDVITTEEVEQIRSELERTEAEITNNERLIADVEQQLSSYDMPDYGTSSSDTRNALASAIQVQREQLKLVQEELSPQSLESPINGTVSRIHRSNGSHLQSNDPIATIVSSEPTYIYGFLQHPLQIEPEVGMEVQVITQGRQQKAGEAEIVEIGSGLEDIEQQYLTTGGNPTPLGLPVKVNITPGMDLKPGELVDITF